jgi:hypothetical protein
MGALLRWKMVEFPIDSKNELLGDRELWTVEWAMNGMMDENKSLRTQWIKPIDNTQKAENVEFWVESWKVSTVWRESEYANCKGFFENLMNRQLNVLNQNSNW